MLEHNGKEYARVTEILSHLNDWSGIDPTVLARKAQIGTNVHKYIEEYNAGSFPIPPDESLGYFDSYIRWAKEWNPKIIKAEERYFDEDWMITGQIDMLIQTDLSFEGGPGLTLIDFKTSANPSPTWPLQAHLYHHLASKAGLELSKRMLFIQLDKRGKLPTCHAYFFESHIMYHCERLVEKFWAEKKKDCQ